MSRYKKIGILVTAVALLLGVAGSGYATPVLQENFQGPVNGLVGAGSIVPTRDGFAYEGPGGDKVASYVRHSLKGLGFNPKAGTLELDLTRGEKMPKDDTCENLVGFEDTPGNGIVLLAICWDWDPIDEGRTLPALKLMAHTNTSYHVQTQTRDAFSNRVYIPGAYLKKNISRGMTVHIALTWGPQDVKLYVDGLPLVGDALDIPGLVAQFTKAQALTIGAYTDKEDKLGAVGIAASLIANVQLHDKQLVSSEFAQPIVSAVPVITAVKHDAFQAAGFSGKLVAGNSLQVTMDGTPGAVAGFDLVHLSDLDGKINLDWKGYGVYLENKAFFEEGEINLRDVNGYLVYVSKSPIDLLTPGIEPVEPLLDVQVQSYTLKDLDRESPYYVAVLAEMRDGSRRTVMASPMGVPMTETAPGVYSGVYTIGSKDRYPKAVVVGHLNATGVGSSLTDTVQLTIDASLTIAVAASPAELRADEKSTSTVTVTVTDANQNPVVGHKIEFVLATTSQYTGVVGGGAFTEQVGGSIKESMWGLTDLFGKVTATYVAGFAAKTAIIVARDMTSNDTGAGCVKTFIQASVQLELQEVKNTALMAEGYEIAVTSSDEWLTADGKSQARITARVTLAGQPVEGHAVGFSVSGNGTIHAVLETTNRNGEARAVYTAGKKIGIALITATDTTAGISGSVQIELRSDAPAKIAITITPEKLPADGRSTAELLVLVTDINDNPNDNTEVEYSLTGGGGQLRDEKGLTNTRGESASEYVAGRTPGQVTIQITVRSTVPTEEELGKARNLALAVTDYKFF